MSNTQSLESGLVRENATTVRVYHWALRIWHWVTALCIVLLAVTGYLIGSPPPSIGGEASASFLFGTIRFLHFAAGLTFAVGMLFRVGYAIFGGPLLREVFIPRIDRAQFRRDFFADLRFYLFLQEEPSPSVGHNPVAQLTMTLFFTLPALFMTATGLALYGEGVGEGSWLDTWFGWLGPLLGGSQNMHTLHHLTMWVIVCFTIMHVYAVVREDVLGGGSTLSAMVSGRRFFRGESKKL